MAATRVDQEPDCIVPDGDAPCKKCNKLEAPRCEDKVLNNTESQTDFNIAVSSCILCSNKDNKFMIQCAKCKFTKLLSTDVLKYSQKIYLLSVCRSF